MGGRGKSTICSYPTSKPLGWVLHSWGILPWDPLIFLNNICKVGSWLIMLLLIILLKEPRMILSFIFFWMIFHRYRSLKTGLIHTDEKFGTPRNLFDHHYWNSGNLDRILYHGRASCGSHTPRRVVRYQRATYLYEWYAFSGTWNLSTMHNASAPIMHDERKK